MWVIFAIGASALWGITYVLGEQIYKKINVITSLSLATFFSGFVMLVVAYIAGYLKRDLVTLATDRKLLWLSIAEAACLVLAELLIGFSIVSKNATLAGLVEISYPIFIAIFALILFKESQISTATIVGGAMIFLGIFIVYYFNL